MAPTGGPNTGLVLSWHWGTLTRPAPTQLTCFMDIICDCSCGRTMDLFYPSLWMRSLTRSFVLAC